MSSKATTAQVPRSPVPFVGPQAQQLGASYLVQQAITSFRKEISEADRVFALKLVLKETIAPSELDGGHSFWSSEESITQAASNRAYFEPHKDRWIEAVKQSISKTLESLIKSGKAEGLPARDAVRMALASLRALVAESVRPEVFLDRIAIGSERYLPSGISEDRFLDSFSAELEWEIVSYLDQEGLSKQHAADLRALKLVSTAPAPTGRPVTGGRILPQPKLSVPLAELPPSYPAAMIPQTQANQKKVLGGLPEYKSPLKRAIRDAFIRTPKTTATLALCRSLDSQGSVKLPTTLQNANDRSLVSVYNDPNRRARLETIVSKVRKDMRDAGFLP